MHLLGNGFLTRIVERNDEGVAYEPVVKVHYLPDSESVLLDPLGQTLTSSPLRELWGLVAKSFKHRYMLPSVVVVVVKQFLTLLVF